MDVPAPSPPPIIGPVTPLDLWRVNALLNANMTGSGQSDWLYRLTSMLIMPPLLLFSGRGYKATVEGRLAGVVYVNFRRRSGYIFNLVTAAPYRRRGIARALLRQGTVAAAAAGRRWMGLYVEAANHGARQLYEAEGYRYYRPQGWRGRLPEPSRAAVRLEPVSPLRQRSLLVQWRDRERAAGDSWAAGVVGDDYAAAPSGGQLYSCLLRDQQVGVLWARSDPRRVTGELFVEPDCWGDAAWHAALLSAMAATWGTGRSLDLFPGSGDHWQAVAPAMRTAGFTPLERHQLLMLKPPAA